MSRRLLSLLAALTLGGCSLVGIRTEEQPPYTVAESLGGGVEVRAYGPRLAAETIVAADGTDGAQGQAFRTLAGYIFGANRAEERIAMTAPVETASGAREIAMTAPVETAESADGLTMRFFMPAGFTRATLPEPTNERVRLVEVPGATLAVLRFTGRGTPSAVAERQDELKLALAGTPWRVAGEPVALFYDPPWTIPFLRRNEVAIPVTR